MWCRLAKWFILLPSLSSLRMTGIGWLDKNLKTVGLGPFKASAQESESVVEQDKTEDTSSSETKRLVNIKRVRAVSRCWSSAQKKFFLGFTDPRWPTSQKSNDVQKLLVLANFNQIPTVPHIAAPELDSKLVEYLPDEPGSSQLEKHEVVGRGFCMCALDGETVPNGSSSDPARESSAAVTQLEAAHRRIPRPRCQVRGRFDQFHVAQVHRQLASHPLWMNGRRGCVDTVGKDANSRGPQQWVPLSQACGTSPPMSKQAS